MTKRSLIIFEISNNWLENTIKHGMIRPDIRAKHASAKHSGAKDDMVRIALDSQAAIDPLQIYDVRKFKRIRIECKTILVHCTKRAWIIVLKHFRGLLKIDNPISAHSVRTFWEIGNQRNVSHCTYRIYWLIKLLSGRLGFCKVVNNSDNPKPAGSG